MRWTPGGTSSDIEDRRSEGGGGLRGTHLSVGGAIVLLLLSIIFKQDFTTSFFGSSSGGAAARQSSPAPIQDSAEANLVQFVSFVLDDAQRVWERILPENGTPYRHAKLVLFRDATDSSCGLAQSASGPFYCAADEKVYIDLGFYDERKSRFGAPGEFVQACETRARLMLKKRLLSSDPYKPT